MFINEYLLMTALLTCVYGKVNIYPCKENPDNPKEKAMGIGSFDILGCEGVSCSIHKGNNVTFIIGLELRENVKDVVDLEVGYTINNKYYMFPDLDHHLCDEHNPNGKIEDCKNPKKEIELEYTFFIPLLTPSVESKSKSKGKLTFTDKLGGVIACGKFNYTFVD